VKSEKALGSDGFQTILFNMFLDIYVEGNKDLYERHLLFTNHNNLTNMQTNAWRINYNI